jgi:hypothetical protein
MTNASFFHDCKDDKQIGGNHYKKNYLIEPWYFIRYNKFDAFQAQIIKYITRYEDKDTIEENLNKIIDYCQKELKIRKTLKELNGRKNSDS